MAGKSLRQLFTLADVAAATGGQVSPNTLHQWISRGLLATPLNPLGGRRLQFHVLQVLGIALICEFKRAGIDLERAADWARSVVGQIVFQRHRGDIVAFNPRDKAPMHFPRAEFVNAVVRDKTVVGPLTIIDLAVLYRQVVAALQEGVAAKVKIPATLLAAFGLSAADRARDEARP